MTVSLLKKERSVNVDGPSEISAKIPVERGRFPMGVLSEFRKNPLNLYTRVMREHGDLVKVHYGPIVGYHVTHPDYISHILIKNNRNYCRNDMSRQLLIMITGQNVLSSEGDYWFKQRRILQPVFLRKRIQGFSEIMTQNAAQMLDRWQELPDNQALDVNEEMMELTYKIVGLSLFGVDLSDSSSQMGHIMNVNNEFFMYRIANVTAPPLWVPTRRNREFKKAQTLLADLGPSMVSQRRQEIAEQGTADEAGRQYDMIDLLLEARYEDSGEGMADEQISMEINTMLGAGHETTSNTLSWTIYLLSQHPDVEAKVHAEVDRVLDGRVPTVEDLKELVYTKMVLNESMRLYPAAWAMSRQTIEPDRLGKYDIPAGASTLISIHAVHRHPDFWDDPERFAPERFAPEKVKEMHRFAFMPFGGGPRQCIGQGFAEMESQLLLTMIAQRFRLRLVPGHPVEPEPLITLRLKHGLMMTLEKR